MTPSPPNPTTPRVILAEVPPTSSAVMGRSAVAVLVACWQLPAVGFLVGVTPSAAIQNVGSDLVSYAWSVSFVVAGLLMLVLYLLQDAGDRAVAELGVLSALVAAVSVYLVALFAGGDSEPHAWGLIVTAGLVALGARWASRRSTAPRRVGSMLAIVLLYVFGVLVSIEGANDGSLAVVALLASLIANCLGRGFLLIRELIVARQVVRGYDL